MILYVKWYCNIVITRELKYIDERCMQCIQYQYKIHQSLTILLNLRNTHNIREVRNEIAYIETAAICGDFSHEKDLSIRWQCSCRSPSASTQSDLRVSLSASMYNMVCLIYQQCRSQIGHRSHMLVGPFSRRISNDNATCHAEIPFDLYRQYSCRSKDALYLPALVTYFVS